ncbi:MAG: DUF3857 domain-containing protein (plasmid) [Candidatus Algichlamydia australiensis]|nr:DUF3857 domain-containing protein [Chlamydiales bacterium]
MRYFLLFTIFSVKLLSNSIAPDGIFLRGPTPSWVENTPFDLDANSRTENHETVHYLLVENQENWVEKAFYKKIIAKATSQHGARDLAKIEIGIDPNHQKVVFHKIQIFREGKWEDRLRSSRKEIYQPEEALNQGIFQGRSQVAYFLEDIRKGDILEYSFTIEGQNPLFANKLSKTIRFQYGVSVEKQTYRILSYEGHDFSAKCHMIEIPPCKTKKLPNQLQEWTWEKQKTLVPVLENYQPDWYDPYGVLEVSEFNSWREVANIFTPLFQLPNNWQENSLQMQQLVQKWQVRTHSTKDLITLAVRFVQDEIRYMGFEDGIHAHKPSPPWETLKRRYGDCKDKTLLLRSLLKIANVPSYPVLVHSEKGTRLNDSLPLSNSFDHVILQILTEEKSLFVDPTINLQGGSLDDNYFPDYGWGLPLQKNSPGLIKLPTYQAKKPTTISSKISLVNDETAKFTVKKEFFEKRADGMRRYAQWSSPEDYAKDYLEDLQKVYGSAELGTSPSFEDDRLSNCFRANLEFLIPVKKTDEKHSLKVFTFTSNNYFLYGINPSRKSPLAVYPFWVKENIEVVTPYDNNLPKVTDHFDHDSFLFNHCREADGKKVFFEYELKYLKDHVTPNTIKAYWDASNKLMRHQIWKLNLKPTELVKESSDLEPFISLFFWGAIALIVASKRRKRPNYKP